MDEQQIRRLVRQAIARHLGPQDHASPPAAPVVPTPAAIAAAAAPPAAAGLDRHPSALRFVLLRAPEDTACIVEPSVACNHCGYCQCYGH